jgi:hypothetical protein
VKVLAARRRDAEDIKTLVTHLRLTSMEQVLTICADVFAEEVEWFLIALGSFSRIYFKPTNPMIVYSAMLLSRAAV